MATFESLLDMLPPQIFVTYYFTCDKVLMVISSTVVTFSGPLLLLVLLFVQVTIPPLKKLPALPKKNSSIYNY